MKRIFEGTLERMIELDYCIDCYSKSKGKQDETGHPQYHAHGCVPDSLYGLCTDSGSLQ